MIDLPASDPTVAFWGSNLRYISSPKKAVIGLTTRTKSHRTAESTSHTFHSVCKSFSSARSKKTWTKNWPTMIVMLRLLNGLLGRWSLCDFLLRLSLFVWHSVWEFTDEGTREEQQASGYISWLYMTLPPGSYSNKYQSSKKNVRRWCRGLQQSNMNL